MLSSPGEEYANKTATLTADQLAVVTRELKEDLFATKHLLETIASGEPVDLPLAYSILYVKEARVAQVSKALGIELDSNDAREKRYAEIRAANERVRELEAQLGATGTPEQTTAKLKHLSDKVSWWWDVKGFGHVSKLHFGSWGYTELDLSCHLFGTRVLSSMSDTPVSDKSSYEQWVDGLRERGFELIEDAQESREAMLADTDHNRALLRDVIKEAFPSGKLLSTENRMTRKGLAYLIGVKVFINELADLEALPEKPSRK